MHFRAFCSVALVAACSRQALWGYDATARGLVSAAADNGSGLRIFRAPGWSDGSVTFERVMLSDTVPRPERFT